VSRHLVSTFSLRRAPSFLKGKLLGVLCVTLLVAAWYLLTRGAAEERSISPAVLPSPLEVVESFGTLVRDRDLVQSVVATLTRVFLGFGLSILVGVPLGLLAGSFRELESFLAPLSIFGRNIPVAALIPLTLFWFGIGESQKIMFIFIATLPFVFADAASSVVAIHERYVETAQTLGATPWQIVGKILVPLAMPDIFTSSRALFGIGFGYIMLAELVAAEHGLGYLIAISQRRGLQAHIWGILLVITLIAFAVDRLLHWLQRGLFPYRKDL
jgi:ABC-type nitrate/sulfonate/bicarbonate transport system permease component